MTAGEQGSLCGETRTRRAIGRHGPTVRGFDVCIHEVLPAIRTTSFEMKRLAA